MGGLSDSPPVPVAAGDLDLRLRLIADGLYTSPASVATIEEARSELVSARELLARIAQAQPTHVSGSMIAMAALASEWQRLAREALAVPDREKPDV